MSRLDTSVTSCSGRRLRIFGHIVRSDSDEDHSRALAPQRWHRRPAVVLVKHGYVMSRTTSNNRIWQWTVVGPAQIYHLAYDRDQWREIGETATLLQGHAPRYMMMIMMMSRLVANRDSKRYCYRPVVNL